MKKNWTIYLLKYNIEKITFYGQEFIPGFFIGVFMSKLKIPFFALSLIVIVFSGCSSKGKIPSNGGTIETGTPLPGSRYSMIKDAYPEEDVDVSTIPNAVPTDEPYSRGGNRSSYQVWGKTYNVLDTHEGYSESGSASWYGKKFHGHKTSNGEIYDMYRMTAAHKSLPIPSFASVKNLENGKEVIVRINDRGPFHSDRIIDLSYAAAKKLGYKDKGTANVKVDSITVSNNNAYAIPGNANNSLIKSKPLSDLNKNTTELSEDSLYIDVGKSGKKTRSDDFITVNGIVVNSNSERINGSSINSKPISRLNKDSVELSKVGFFIQIGAFSQRERADLFMFDSRNKLGMPISIVQEGRGLLSRHKVLVGPYSNNKTAKSNLDFIKRNGFFGAFISKKK